MRVFDWRALLARERVAFIERGPNVKRGEINIRCPWCGTADPSFHLGLNLESGWYSCWRNKSGHSGKSPLRLLMRLLNVSYGRARELAGLGADYVDPEGFDALAARLMGREVASHAGVKVKREFLDLDPEFKVITEQLYGRWFDYLWCRGFDGKDLPKLCHDYCLRAARFGDFAGRLIIPYFLDGELVTWTGRAIGESTIRYKDLSVADSLVPVKQTLFNHDAINEGGKALVIVEGPLDALKLDFYGKPFGVRAVGLSTNSLSEDQAFMLEASRGRFRQVGTMMDNKSDFGRVDSMRLKQELSFIPDLRIYDVPFDRPDPGDLTPREVQAWAHNLIH